MAGGKQGRCRERKVKMVIREGVVGGGEYTSVAYVVCD